MFRNIAPGCVGFATCGRRKEKDLGLNRANGEKDFRKKKKKKGKRAIGHCWSDSRTIASGPSYTRQ